MPFLAVLQVFGGARKTLRPGELAHLAAGHWVDNQESDELWRFDLNATLGVATASNETPAKTRQSWEAPSSDRPPPALSGKTGLVSWPTQRAGSAYWLVQPLGPAGFHGAETSKVWGLELLAFGGEDARGVALNDSFSRRVPAGR